MNKKSIISLVALGAMLLPLSAFAIILPGSAPAGALNLTTIFTAILNLLWVIFIGLAVIMFLVAGFQFVTAQGEPSELKKARDSMIWGVVGIIAGVVAFSLPAIVANFFGAG